MGNIPGLSMLLTSYCKKLPALIIQYSNQIFLILTKLLKATRTHPFAFQILTSIIRFISIDLVLPLLPEIFNITIYELLNGNALKYKQNFALFLCNACFLLNPDNVLHSLGGDLDQIIEIWANSLSSIRYRVNYIDSVSGILTVLTESQIISNDHWKKLFIGVVTMIEMPSRDSLQEDIQLYREEELASQEFDSTFNKLIYSDLTEPIHPDLTQIDITEYLAIHLSLFSRNKPGIVLNTINNDLSEQLKSSFRRYCEKYDVEFF